MTKFRWIVIGALAALAGACASPRMTGELTLAEYCAIEKNLDKDVCKINSKIDTESKTAKGLIDSVSAKADKAQASADKAQAQADAALARQDGVFCETRTIRGAKTGQCSPGYTLVSCHQSRFWASAGGPTILRNTDESQCTFASKVLEMKVRCCMVGASAAPKAEALEDYRSGKKYSPAKPVS